MSEPTNRPPSRYARPSWPPKGRLRRAALLLAGTVALAGTAMVLIASGSSASPTNGDNVTLCHATGSTTNPYVVITVDPDAIQTKIFGPNGHGSHDGPIFDPNGGKGQPAWGDIIPPFSYTNGQGSSIPYPGKNWPQGQAILENGCQLPSEVPSSPSTGCSGPSCSPSCTTDCGSPSCTENCSTPTTHTHTPPPHHTSAVVQQQSGAVIGAGQVQSPAQGPIPAGASAGLHLPTPNAALRTWGIVLMLLGGLTGLLVGAWPTRRRAH